jgi:hypothetical protein
MNEQIEEIVELEVAELAQVGGGTATFGLD